MFDKEFQTALVLICIGQLGPATAASPKRDLNIGMAPVVKEVQESGNSLMTGFHHHKKYCWDGRDPDGADLANYKVWDSGLRLLEKTHKFEEAANGLPLPVDNYVEYRLALADAALSANCLNIADEQYRIVLREFTQLRYGHYRDLAKIGVDDVREKRAAQTVIDQEHATPSRVPWELVGKWLPQSKDLISKDIGTCKPKSASDPGPFELKPDGSWGKLVPNAVSLNCVLTAEPFSPDRKSWKVTSTCQPGVTEIWWQFGSARDQITTHDFIDNTAIGGKKSIGSPKVEFRRCD